MRNLLLVLATIASLSLNAQQVAKRLTASNGTQIGFYEYKPTDYSTSKPKYPLIIFLHGTGEKGNGTTDLARVTNVGIAKLIKKGNPMKFTYNGKTETFLVLSPQLSPSFGRWQPFYVDAMIEYAKANLNVDPNRIYLTGLSLGGGGVWGFSSETLQHAQELAAIVPICGTCALSSPANIAEADLAVWAFHAQDDNRVSVNCTKNAIKAINGRNPSVAPKVTIWPTGKHTIWDRVYDPSLGYLKGENIYQWLLSHSRNGVAPTANKKPVANAGADVSLKAGVSSARLDGSASKDPDGEIVSYTWRKVSGPVSGVLSAATGNIVQLTGITLPGTYTYELKVVDNKGASAVDKVVVRVAVEANTPNKKPKADAGANRSLTLPTNTVTLTGSGSQDQDGKIATYKWTKVSGPASFKIASPTSETTNITSLKAGKYVFRLTVTDDAKATAFDDVEVIVKAQEVANKAPIANGGGNLTITLPTQSITVKGIASKDPDGKIVKYEWRKVSGPSSFRFYNANAKTTLISKLVAGVYVFRLTVTDNDRATAFDDVTITVNGAAKKNQAPRAIAGNDIHITLPAAKAVLDGSASADADGSIATYKWTKVGGPKGFKIINGDNPTATVQDLDAGTYTFRLTVTDNGKLSSSDNVMVYVKRSTPRASNRAPIVTVGANVSIALPTNSVQLSGQGSRDPDGSIASFRWFVLSGPSGATFANSSAMNTTVTGLKEGTYIVRLEATDNDGKKSYDDKRIIVEPRNIAPVIDAGENVTVTLPQNRVVLNGRGSRDADGSIVSYHWRVLQGPGKYSFQNSKAAVTSITNLEEGQYVIRLEATDNKGAYAYDDMALTVLPFNQKPLVNAGENVVITLPINKAVLNGKETRDPDGSIVSYKWRVLKGPNKYSLNNANNASTLITNLVAGTYTLRLEVMDNRGAISFDDVNVIVQEGRTTNAGQAYESTAGVEAADSSVAISSPHLGELTTGVAAGKIRTYPNPAVSTLTVELPDSTTGKATIQVFDMNGRIVKNLGVQKNQLLLREQLDVSKLLPGMYLLEININNKTKMNSRFIKQ